jgi:hypothetical protein
MSSLVTGYPVGCALARPTVEVDFCEKIFTKLDGKIKTLHQSETFRGAYSRVTCAAKVLGG